MSTAPVGTKGGVQRVRGLRLVSDGKSTLVETTAEYNSTSGGVEQSQSEQS